MISVVGHTATDHILLVPSFPDRHGSTFILDHQIYFGGGAANIAAGIAKLGCQSQLISVVGDDFSGSEYDCWLSCLGVCCSLFVIPGEHTATAYLINDQQGDQITLFEWGASEHFREQVAPALDFVHLATADPEFNVNVAAKAAFCSFDPGQDLLRYSAGQLEAILTHADILFANAHELAGMARILGTSPDAVIGSVPMAIITYSGEGSMLHEGNFARHVPAVPVTLVDPTGAGDAYRAGFLTAYARGYPPLTCCRIGTVCASFVVEKVGCQTNLPDWEAMEHRYEAHFGPLEGISQ
jgi:sugar/nucleoside kinase (ribokinase family)